MAASRILQTLAAMSGPGTLLAVQQVTLHIGNFWHSFGGTCETVGAMIQMNGPSSKKQVVWVMDAGASIKPSGVAKRRKAAAWKC